MTRLSGARILIVEDDWLIASQLSDVLTDEGAKIVGPFANMIDALQNLSDLTAIDGAILDVGLGEVTSYPLAEALKTTQIPYMFLTGLPQDQLPKEFARARHLQKPFRSGELVRLLLDMGVCDT